MVMCFEKQKCSNPKCFISKKYRQRFLRCENFNYKRPLIFELRTVELAVWFYWFLNSSPQIKADENSTKVPIPNTNFSNKVPISESYHKNVTLPESFKLMYPLTIKWRLFQVLTKFVENLILADIVQLHKYQVFAFIIVPASRKRQQGSDKFRTWKVLIVKWRSFQFSTKFAKKSVVFTSERDISCYIFQNISRSKLLIREKIPDIITYRW